MKDSTRTQTTHESLPRRGDTRSDALGLLPGSRNGSRSISRNRTNRRLYRKRDRACPCQLQRVLRSWGKEPLKYYLVFMFFGVFAGGLFSALRGRRVKFQVERGEKRARKMRARPGLGWRRSGRFRKSIGPGCTSGQALSGSAMLLSGSLVFLLCVFAGGYGAAWFVRRQWHD